MPGDPPRVALRGIVKRFGETVANDGIDLDVRAGEVHAIVGENGAGKSTLVRVLAGLERADAGEVTLDGTPVHFAGPRAAARAGIALVHQSFSLVPTLTVADNVRLGERGPFLLTRGRRRHLDDEVRHLAEEHGLAVDPHAVVSDLGVGERQRVEIVRALRRAPSVLILDEPTSNLAPAEAEAVLGHCRDLAHRGVAVVVVTHHLDAAVKAADRITVLRAGRRVATLDAGATDARELAGLMVGTATTQARGHPPAPPTGVGGPAVLTLDGVSSRHEHGVGLAGVSLTVARREIVAVVGVDGNGQAELEAVVAGRARPARGQVLLGGVDVARTPPLGRLRRGLAVVPADRARHGVIASLSVADNLVLDRTATFPYGSWWRRRPREVRVRALELMRRHGIPGPPERPVSELSGGQAQRVVLARALSGEPRVLLAAQPTRGLDVAAASAVHDALRQRRASGGAVLLISSDLDEVVDLADRAVVLFEGQVVASFAAPFDRQAIGEAMGGRVAAGTAP